MLAGQGGYTMLVYLLIQTYLKKGQKAQVGTLLLSISKYTMLVYLLIQTDLKKGQKAQVILSKR